LKEEKWGAAAPEKKSCGQGKRAGHLRGKKQYEFVRQGERRPIKKKMKEALRQKVKKKIWTVPPKRERWGGWEKECGPGRRKRKPQFYQIKRRISAGSEKKHTC